MLPKIQAHLSSIQFSSEWRPASRPEAAQKSEGLSGGGSIEFRCVRNAACHEDMEAFYARMHRLFTFVVVVVGTAFNRCIARKENEFATLGTAFAVLAGLIDLLWDVGGMDRMNFRHWVRLDA